MKKYRYSPGDRVQVIPKFEPKTYYYMRSGEQANVERQGTGVRVIYDRLKLQGKIVTISRISSFNSYKIKEDGGSNPWTDDMFVGLAEGVRFNSLL